MPFVISLMPASKTVTWPSSSIRNTFMTFVGKPPWTSHTPAATCLKVGLKSDPRSLVRALNAPAMRCSILLSGGRQEPHRARELGAVVVGVVVLDLAVLDRQQVDALELDPRPGRLDALERPSAERARRAPAHGRLVAGRDQVQHLHPPVGHGGEGLVEEGAQLVGRAQVAVQRSEVVDAALGPAIRHRIHVTCRDGIEVHAGDPAGPRHLRLLVTGTLGRRSAHLGGLGFRPGPLGGF